MKRVEGPGKHFADKPEISISFNNDDTPVAAAWIYCYFIIDLLQLQCTFIIM